MMGMEASNGLDNGAEQRRLRRAVSGGLRSVVMVMGTERVGGLGRLDGEPGKVNGVDGELFPPTDLL